MKRLSRVLAVGLGTALLVFTMAAPVGAAAPTGAGPIHPGVQMYTSGQQCTANFVFNDASGRVYVGYAAHCAGLSGATQTDGCAARSRPLGTRVTFNEGGSPLGEGRAVGRGRLAYSSWLTMQRRGGASMNACLYNDFALVRVDRADRGKVDPTVPHWGGPTGIDRDGTSAGDRFFAYGNSSLRGGVELLSPQIGIGVGDLDGGGDGGWSHTLYSVGPGIPGDSGAGMLNDQGQAVGTLSSLGLLPLPASNNVGDLAKELAYAQKHAGIRGLRLVKGTKAFSSSL